MPRTRILAAVLGLSLLAALAGCQTFVKLRDKFDPRELPAQKEYYTAIKPYLVDGTIYRGPATELMVHIMPLCKSVRMAMNKRKAVALNLTTQQEALGAADQMAAYERGIELAVSLYVPEEQWKKLGGDKPIWNFYIENQRGVRLHATDYRRVKERTPLTEALYPFWGLWDRMYRITFPYKTRDGAQFLQAGENGFTLVVAGAPGKVVMKAKWN